MAGATLTITDAGMVMISVLEYEELVRDSERLCIVENYIRNTKYTVTNDLKIMLGIDVEPDGERKGEE